MDIYILLSVIIVCGTILIVLQKKNKNNEISALKDALEKTLIKMEEDNKNIKQGYIDQNKNIKDVVLQVVKENTESQKEIFEKESSNLINTINKQSKDFNDYFTRIDTSILNLDSVTKDMKTEINDFSKIIGNSSSQSGKFGEYQLENLFKFHNLQKDIDYMTQVSVKTDDGDYRLDAVLLSQEKCLIIDSKATSNIEVIKELKTEETSKDRIDQIKKEIKDKVTNEANKLSKKGYHNIVLNEKYHTPEFIIMFVPNENVFLIVKELLNKETNMIAEGVILAGPDNLNFIILMWHYMNGILKVQDQIADIRDAATQIHNRFGTAAEHFTSLRNSLESSINNWNKLVSSVDSRLIPSVKRLEEMGIKSSKDFNEIGQIKESPDNFKKLPKNN
ncbi:MAG: DNA recombination protein RmuC [Deltaproteobacteria bacterium TMED126]|nr:DNA recombination protein RmuC [Deltaproteobacteria bacterium TMED126]NSW98425.1 DNA recombination protein RmuC [bacterium]|tara:strand:+ start:252 stop:1424 length:1173 start_codon:yes stop_codon:yes gene_type:complete